MIELRDYQLLIKSELYRNYNSGLKKLLAVLPTGAGKTAIAASILKDCKDSKKQAVLLVHRRELINQSGRTFDAFGMPYGIIASNYDRSPYELTQIASIQTLINRLDEINPRFIIIDEAHHTCANTWDRVYHHFPDALVLGLTATPVRADGQGLHKYYEKIVHGPSITSLIDQGWLTPFKYYAPKTEIDLSGVSISMGDYDKKELAKVIDKPKITGDVVENYLKYSNRKRAIVFAVNIEHSNHIINAFKAHGIPAKHVDGSTPTNERDKAVDDFTKGNLMVLSNVGLFSEGFDVPGIETVIVVRPTHSLSLHLQMIGRALRLAPCKTHANIIDHVENYKRHGLPSDHREWSLHSAKRRFKKGDEHVVPIKRCEYCFTVNPIVSLICSNCLEPFPIKEKTAREILEEHGDLVEIDQKKQMRMEVGKAKTIGDLQKIAQERGYKPGWVWKQLQIKKLI